MSRQPVEPSTAPPSTRRESLLDVLSAVLFSWYVVFLFVGYLGWWPKLPSVVLAPAFLLAALAVLFWANFRVVRTAPGRGSTLPHS